MLMKTQKNEKKWSRTKRKKVLREKKRRSKKATMRKNKIKQDRGRSRSYTYGTIKLSCSNGTTMFLEDLITFLAICNVSTRALEYFCRTFFALNWSRARIQEIIENAAEVARTDLKKLDTAAQKNTRMLNLDTTWKGKVGKVLGAIDPETGYVYALDWISKENGDAMTPSLAHLAELCSEVEYLITDMSSAFEKAIPEHFQACSHILCQVHALRDLFNSISGLRHKMKKTLIQKRKAKQKLETTKYWLKKNQNNYFVTKNRLKKKQNEKKVFLQNRGYETKENGALVNTKQGLPREAKLLAKAVYKVQVREARYLRQVEKQRLKLPVVREEYEVLKEKYLKHWNRYIVAVRRLHCFSKLFYIRDQEKYRQKKDEWHSRLLHRTDKLSKQMKSFLQTKSGLFPGEHEEHSQVTSKYWNTNQVESLFSRVKPTLNALRILPNTRYINDRLDLLRWWLNTQAPLSGINRFNPPIKRCGLSPVPFTFVEV